MLSFLFTLLARVSENSLLTVWDNVGARPAGACTCERAATENQKPTENACACGMRAAST